MTLPTGPRPDVFALTEQETDRVRELLHERRFRCAGCGGAELGIGHCFYLGFVFVGEELDHYMVGLTCRNPECPAPYTGITLRESEVLSAPRRYPV
jgi:hypothetical protein